MQYHWLQHQEKNLIAKKWFISWPLLGLNFISLMKRFYKLLILHQIELGIYFSWFIYWFFLSADSRIPVSWNLDLGLFYFIFFFRGVWELLQLVYLRHRNFRQSKKFVQCFLLLTAPPFLPSNFAPIGAWSIPLASGCGSFNWSPTGHLIGLWFVVRIANVSITSSKKYIYICPAEESSEGETWSYFRDFHTLSISV